MAALLQRCTTRAPRFLNLRLRLLPAMAMAIPLRDSRPLRDSMPWSFGQPAMAIRGMCGNSRREVPLYLTDVRSYLSEEGTDNDELEFVLPESTQILQEALEKGRYVVARFNNCTLHFIGVDHSTSLDCRIVTAVLGTYHPETTFAEICLERFQILRISTYQDDEMMVAWFESGKYGGGFMMGDMLDSVFQEKLSKVPQDEVKEYDLFLDEQEENEEWSKLTPQEQFSILECKFPNAVRVYVHDRDVIMAKNIASHIIPFDTSAAVVVGLYHLMGILKILRGQGHEKCLSKSVYVRNLPPTVMLASIEEVLGNFGSTWPDGVAIKIPKASPVMVVGRQSTWKRRANTASGARGGRRGRGRGRGGYQEEGLRGCLGGQSSGRGSNLDNDYSRPRGNGSCFRGSK